MSFWLHGYCGEWKSWARKPGQPHQMGGRSYSNWPSEIGPLCNRTFCGVICVVTLPFWHFCWFLALLSWDWVRSFPFSLDLHRIMSGCLHGALTTGAACQQETLILPDTWLPPPFWDLLLLHLLIPDSSKLSCLYSTFHLEYPLVLSRFCFETPL